MRLIDALFAHAWLALSLQHQGTGLPSKFPAALFLVSLYAGLTLANQHVAGGVDFQTVSGLIFVMMFYLFGLRNSIIGLILLISIINNSMALALILFAGIPSEELDLMMVMEYIMIFAGMINIIKCNTSITEL